MTLNERLAENVAARKGTHTINISGLWIRSVGDHIELLAEDPATGMWATLFSEQFEGNNFSHIFEPDGIKGRFFVEYKPDLEKR
jgi:hypothetical protein